jgi:curved DNA-binding protein CbpA
MKDYYSIFEISSQATMDDIKKQYKKLALRYHPDKNNNSDIYNSKFQDINDAYSVLSNPKKRLLYDIHKQFEILEPYELSDKELFILYHFYNKMVTSTEIKFLKCLYYSFPSHLKEKVKSFFTICKSTSIQPISHFKYIDASNVHENYNIQLYRQLQDVYNNITKLIILKTKQRYIHLFITHSDYTFTIYNSNSSILTISIETIPDKPFYKQGSHLYYQHTINIYELYYGSRFMIHLPNKLRLHCIANELIDKNQSIIKRFGCKDNKNQRGDLIIKYHLDKTKIDPKYKSVLHTIFHKDKPKEFEGIIYRL